MSLEFRELHLRNWKNFAKVDMDIGRRVFLIGANASGKSNLLDPFRFLRGLARSGGGFQEAVHLRDDVSAIRCLAARRYADIEIRAVLGESEGAPDCEYELTFRQDQQRRQLVGRECVIHVSIGGHKERGKPKSGSLTARCA